MVPRAFGLERVQLVTVIPSRLPPPAPYSLLHSLRCSVHMELAGITADRNQLQTALEHLQKVVLRGLYYIVTYL